MGREDHGSQGRPLWELVSLAAVLESEEERMPFVSPRIRDVP